MQIPARRSAPGTQWRCRGGLGGRHYTSRYAHAVGRGAVCRPWENPLFQVPLEQLDCQACDAHVRGRKLQDHRLIFISRPSDRAKQKEIKRSHKFPKLDQPAIHPKVVKTKNPRQTNPSWNPGCTFLSSNKIRYKSSVFWSPCGSGCR